MPRKRTTTFDMRRAIRLMADKDSFFEVGPLWGTDQITGFVRFNGYPMGVIASDSRHANGGALTADGCDKLRRHLDVCDLFHLPMLNLVDNPGFAVGLEHETRRHHPQGRRMDDRLRPGLGADLHRDHAPLVRRRRQQLRHAAVAASRPAWSGRRPTSAASRPRAASRRPTSASSPRRADPAALRAEINARIESARGPIGPLNRFQMEEMIDPRDTRRLICEWAENAWRLVSLPQRLGPRPLGFRP